jgi:hypothetical protein
VTPEFCAGVLEFTIEGEKYKMVRQMFAALALLIATGGTATAGHHHFFGGYPVVAVPAYQFVYPVAAPVVYQPAYVVPTPTAVYAPMVPTVPTVSAYYAPQYSTAGYYLAPSPAAYVRPVSVHPIGFGRRYRGYDEVEVELKYRRDGGFRYEVDYDD